MVWNLNHFVITTHYSSASAPVPRYWSYKCHMYIPTSWQVVCVESWKEDCWFCVWLFMNSACIRSDEYRVHKWIIRVRFICGFGDGNAWAAVEEQRCHSANCHHLSRVVFSSEHQLFKMESFIKHVRECGLWQHNDEQGSTFWGWAFTELPIKCTHLKQRYGQFYCRKVCTHTAVCWYKLSNLMQLE